MQLSYEVIKLSFFNICRWGCNHEKDASRVYEAAQRSQHQNFKLSESGLHLHPAFPYLGATPDGIIECDCCGKGVLEIKCPYCKRGKALEEASEDTAFCLEKVGADLSLKKDHPYFFQVQGQMMLTDTTYSDFVVWTDNDIQPHIERITYDSVFANDMTAKLCEFFKYAVLPELLARHFTCRPNEPSENTELWCYCRSTAVTPNTVTCSNENCAVKKFHLTCLGLKRMPKSSWMCLHCRKAQRK
jgi:hypothetical protein